MADVNASVCVPGISDKIAESAHKALVILEEILEDKRTEPEIIKIKANVALEMLSRAGYSAVRQLNVRQETMTAHFSLEDIERIKQRAKELGGFNPQAS
jgi:hypothetical protein